MRLKEYGQISFEYPFMESVSDSAIMTSNKLKDQPIVFCNDNFMTLTEYPKEEILGRNCRFLTSRATDPRCNQGRDVAGSHLSKLTAELLGDNAMNSCYSLMALTLQRACLGTAFSMA